MRGGRARLCIAAAILRQVRAFLASAPTVAKPREIKRLNRQGVF
jgi:hypothetical protein